MSSGSDDRRGGQRRAMTIGGIDGRKKVEEGEKATRKKVAVRPSLVGSMKPRQTIQSNEKLLKKGKNDPAGAEGRTRETSSSPMLTSRLQDNARIRSQSDKKKNESKENLAPVESSSRNKRKSHPAVEEEEEEAGIIISSKSKGKQKKVVDDESEREEEAEHAEREFVPSCTSLGRS